MIGLRRGRWLGLAVLAVVGAACSDSDSDDGSEATPPVDESTLPPAADPASTEPRSPTAVPSATAQVVDFYNSLNSGDVDGMVAVWPTGDRGYFVLLADDLRERTAVACSPDEGSDWVVCEEFVRSDFFDPAGIRATFTVRYDVDDGTIIASEVVEVGDETEAFVAEFGAWLEADDPDLYGSSYSAESGRVPLTTTSDVDAILAKVEAFVAQSDVYPVESG